MGNKENLKNQGKESMSESMSCLVNETLSDTLTRVYKQIEIDCYHKTDDKLVKEIALNIAVVYRLPDKAVIKVASNSLLAKDVKDIFHLLTGEHIDFVIEKIKNAGHISYKVSYIRTVLYNSVLEHETQTELLGW